MDFVALGDGMLALMHRPKIKSLPAMKSLGATHLVTLLSRREGAWAVGSAARTAGLEWIWVDPAVVIHCSAGIHRTGMFTYALLRATGEHRLTWAEHLCTTMGRP